MIIPDSRKMATMIVSNLKPKTGEMNESPKEPEKEEDLDKEGLKAIAEDIMEAFEKKDSHSLAVALHDFFELCDSMEDEEEQEESPMMPSLLGPK